MDVEKRKKEQEKRRRKKGDGENWRLGEERVREVEDKSWEVRIQKIHRCSHALCGYFDYHIARTHV